VAAAAAAALLPSYTLRRQKLWDVTSRFKLPVRQHLF
jgi:hypothetical protein